MRYLRLLIILSFFVLKDNQANESVKIIAHGTYLISSIHKDGIMVASDSRIAFFHIEKTGRTLIAYRDSFPKTFIIGKNTLSYSGNATLLNVFISTIINEYKKTLKEDTLNIKYLLPSFFSFVKTKYNLNFSQMIFSGILITSGYDSLKPRIFYYQKVDGIQEMNYNYQSIAESGKSNFRKKASSNLSCEQAGEIAVDVINEYAISNNKTDIIGGPVEICKVTKDSVVVIKNKLPKFKWVYMKDYISDLKSHKTKMFFTSAENEKKFYEHYDKN